MIESRNIWAQVSVNIARKLALALALALALITSCATYLVQLDPKCINVSYDMASQYVWGRTICVHNVCPFHMNAQFNSY